ncbi:MAG: Type II secretion system protein E [bacterium ADurb.Bin363]|nr:MAG: Type II secretion system protein E [bacterium ADurb.Bin363]
MVDVQDSATIVALKSKLKKRVIACKINEMDFYTLTSTYFGVGSGMFTEVKVKDVNFNQDYDIGENQDNAEIIQFVNRVIMDAYKRGSTDIHFEPVKRDILLRFRIDGVLHNVPIPPSIKNVYLAVVSRIKIMSELDIAEKRLPQDGRIKIKIGDKEQDLRVSVIPTINGESVVIRILANQKGEMELEKLGMETDIMHNFRELVHRPNGIVLVTGPTGSGKTTTLFSGIKEINDSSKKIITIEDPVEYQLDGVAQIQVKSDIGLTFAAGLRAILRQDPDIIMIGEIRDKETAEIAIRASLTGHLVFATLHTNDAISSVTRLIDMGIEPYLITSSLIGVLAQRLVRVVCPFCKQEKVLDNGEITAHGDGCDYCFNTGYKGRTSIHELYMIDDATKKDILAGKSNFDIKSNLKKNGWRDLKDDGILKVKKGVTTYEEVYRVAW